MKKTVRSPGSATIINAIATGFGSAFGIGLDIRCEAKSISSGIECANDVGADTGLMDLCVRKVFDHYDIDENDFGVSLKTKSTLPMASGLSSSCIIKGTRNCNASIKRCINSHIDHFQISQMTQIKLLNNYFRCDLNDCI